MVSEHLKERRRNRRACRIYSKKIQLMRMKYRWLGLQPRSPAKVRLLEKRLARKLGKMRKYMKIR